MNKEKNGLINSPQDFINRGQEIQLNLIFFRFL